MLNKSVFFSISLSSDVSKASLSAHLCIANMSEVMGDTAVLVLESLIRVIGRAVQSVVFVCRDILGEAVRVQSIHDGSIGVLENGCSAGVLARFVVASASNM